MYLNKISYDVEPIKSRSIDFIEQQTELLKYRYEELKSIRTAINDLSFLDEYLHQNLKSYDLVSTLRSNLNLVDEDEKLNILSLIEKLYAKYVHHQILCTKKEKEHNYLFMFYELKNIELQKRIELKNNYSDEKLEDILSKLNSLLFEQIIFRQKLL
jgi:hypothetical protein